MSQRKIARHKSAPGSRSARPILVVAFAVELTTTLALGLLGSASADAASQTAPPLKAAPAADVPFAAKPAMSGLHLSPAWVSYAAFTVPVTAKTPTFESGWIAPLPPPPRPKPAVIHTVRPGTVKAVSRNRIEPAKQVTKTSAARKASATKAATVKVTTTKVTKARRAKAKASPKASRPAAGGSIISIARRYVGTPYRYGGTTPSGFDCSGYVGYVYRQAGIRLGGRSANDIWRTEPHVSSPRPGDIILLVNGGRATHAGIYAGPGKMYDAPRTGKTVGLHSYTYYNGSVRFVRP